MNQDVILHARIAPGVATHESGFALPSIIASAGEGASYRFLEFFTANIRNRNTRAAYCRALRPFLEWCEKHGRELATIDPVTIAAYIEQLGNTHAKPTVKQHLAAIRMLFDWMVTGGVLPFNPAASVRGPKYVVKKGKTPVLTPLEARLLLDSIDISELSGPRDRALIAVMVYSESAKKSGVGSRSNSVLDFAVRTVKSLRRGAGETRPFGGSRTARQFTGTLNQQLPKSSPPTFCRTPGSSGHAGAPGAEAVPTGA